MRLISFEIDGRPGFGLVVGDGVVDGRAAVDQFVTAEPHTESETVSDHLAHVRKVIRYQSFQTSCFTTLPASNVSRAPWTSRPLCTAGKLYFTCPVTLVSTGPVKTSPSGKL